MKSRFLSVNQIVPSGFNASLCSDAHIFSAQRPSRQWRLMGEIVWEVLSLKDDRRINTSYLLDRKKG